MGFTFFFRDTQTLRFIVEHLVPLTRGRSKVRIWDAGCAMGQEPYTFAILLAEAMGPFSFRNVLIQATDLEDHGPLIRAGEYPAAELKRIPEEIFQKYFSPSSRDGYFKIDDLIRSRVEFACHDLRTLSPVGDGFSLVLCKNVLLHQSAEQRVEIIRMFHESLADGGLLGMEHTQKMPSELADWFEPLVPNAQVHRKVAVAERAAA